MNFHTHIKNVCRKTGQKLSALLRISPYLDQGKKVLLYNLVTKSQFNYCPLVQMFCSRQSNNLINKVLERSLRLTYRDGTNDFQQILREQNEITIDRSIQNCKRFSTAINEFLFSVSLQQRQHQKFSRNFYWKQKNCQIWYRNSNVSSTFSLGESTH